MKKITFFLLMIISSIGYATTSEYCETEVTHLNIVAETPSAIMLTITNVDATTMYVEIESANSDPVDLLIVNNASGGTISEPDESVAGKIRRTITFTTAPTDVSLEILWSKESMAGNWMLNTFTVPFDATCEATNPASDATLSDLKVNGTTISGFSSSTLNYGYGLASGASIPTVTATATNDGNADVEVTNATTIPGQATVIVNAADDSDTKTYTIDFFYDTPTSGPTVPTHNAADVICVFSDTYTDLEGTNFNPPWSQSTIVTTENISGNSVLKYANFNYQGTQFTSIDASNMEFMHIDMWTADASSVNFYPISTSTGDSYSKALDITIGSWTSYDIPLSYFTDLGASVSDLFQFKFDGGDGSVTIFLDNLYFWKTPTAAGSDATLSDLTIGGTTIDEFSANKTLYTAGLVQGASIPTVGATATDNGNATVSISQASTPLPDTAEVLVTAQDGTTKKTYKIAFAYTTPTSTATTPTHNAANVISIFSDAYTDISGTNFNAQWSQNTIVTTEDISGNSVLKYTNFNYQGTEFQNDIDANDMEYLHIDM